MGIFDYCDSTRFIGLICKNCGRPIKTILKPCPSCGYQHPLTNFGKQLQNKLEAE